MALPLKALHDLARAAASRVLSAPGLFSVLARVSPAGNEVALVQFGFQEPVHSSWRGSRLRSCWIDVSADGTRVMAGPVGEFGAAQIAQLASAGVDFPPPVLEIPAGALELPDVLVAAGAGDSSTERLHLSLCLFASQLAWRAIAERTDGVRTRMLSALDGSVLYDRLDRLRDGGEGPQ